MLCTSVHIGIKATINSNTEIGTTEICTLNTRSIGIDAVQWQVDEIGNIGIAAQALNNWTGETNLLDLETPGDKCIAEKISLEGDKVRKNMPPYTDAKEADMVRSRLLQRRFQLDSGND